MRLEMSLAPAGEDGDIEFCFELGVRSELGESWIPLEGELRMSQNDVAIMGMIRWEDMATRSRALRSGSWIVRRGAGGRGSESCEDKEREDTARAKERRANSGHVEPTSFPEWEKGSTKQWPESVSPAYRRKGIDVVAQ